MSIKQIEDHLVTRIKTHFGSVLKAVDTLPTDFDANEFERVLRLAPGVFISFGFGPAMKDSAIQRVTIASRWTIIAVSGNAGGEKQRRHGSLVEIGAYEIMERLIPLLHDYVVPDVGTLSLMDADNLFSGELDKKGVSMYAAVFTLPMTFESNLFDENGLDDFITFHGDYDLAAPDGSAEAADTVTLEQ